MMTYLFLAIFQAVSIKEAGRHIRYTRHNINYSSTGNTPLEPILVKCIRQFGISILFCKIQDKNLCPYNREKNTELLTHRLRDDILGLE